MTSEDPWSWGWQAVAAIGGAAAAVATAAAAVAALVIWTVDHRRARWARARRVTVQLEHRETPAVGGRRPVHASRVVLVIRNGADSPAYDVNVRESRGQANPMLVNLVPPGGERAVSAAEELIGSPQWGSVELDSWFTMDERRWHIDSNGHLSGGRRVREQTDPPAAPA